MEGWRVVNLSLKGVEIFAEGRSPIGTRNCRMRKICRANIHKHAQEHSPCHVAQTSIHRVRLSRVSRILARQILRIRQVLVSIGDRPSAKSSAPLSVKLAIRHPSMTCRRNHQVAVIDERQSRQACRVFQESNTPIVDNAERFCFEQLLWR